MSKLAQGKTVLITGASSGVGEVLACCLAREGAKLVLISEEKTQDQLKQARAGGWLKPVSSSPRQPGRVTAWGRSTRAATALLITSMCSLPCWSCTSSQLPLADLRHPTACTPDLFWVLLYPRSLSSAPAVPTTAASPQRRSPSARPLLCTDRGEVQERGCLRCGHHHLRPRR